MRFNTIVKGIDEAGFITFHQDELDEMLKESYQRGYNDGIYQNVPVETEPNNTRPPIVKFVYDSEFIA